jgi:hypothetical protein
MTTTKYIVKPVVFPPSVFDNDQPDREFRVVVASSFASDLPEQWYTVIARPANTKLGYRFLAYYRSPLHATSMRGKAQLDAHSVTRKEIIEAVKAHLAAQ